MQCYIEAVRFIGQVRADTLCPLLQVYSLKNNIKYFDLSLKNKNDIYHKHRGNLFNII